MAWSGKGLELASCVSRLLVMTKEDVGLTKEKEIKKTDVRDITQLELLSPGNRWIWSTELGEGDEGRSKLGC